MLKRLLTVLSFTVLPVSSYALTIEEAVNYALESNNLIKSQQLTVKSKDLARQGAILIFLPNMGAEYNYAYNWQDKGKAAGKNELGTGSLSAYVRLNIFNGLNDLALYQTARIDRDMSKLQLDAVGYDTILNAQNAYVRVLKSKRDLEVSKSHLKALEMQKRDAQISADNGLIAKNDLLQTETYLAQAQLQVITAESMVTKALQNLERVIDKKNLKNEQFYDPDVKNVNIGSEEDLTNKMFANNSKLKAQEKSYELAKKTEMRAMSKVYPKIDAFFNYATYGEDGAITGGIPMKGENEMSVGVTASWDVVGIAVSAVDSVSKKRSRQALAYNIANTKQDMVLDLQSAIETYYTSLAKLRQAKIAVKHAEENYRVTKNLYDQSATTMTNLLDASTKLNEAKVQESSANYEVINSVYYLERVIEEKLPVNNSK